jgi:uncharacterized protein YjiS (DUF1127 family)
MKEPEPFATSIQYDLDKLLAIAKSDQNYAMRRRAVNALARSEDPRVKDALKDIVEK